MATEIRLTSYSKGSGCGCKIIPEHLQKILNGNIQQHDEKLLVGNDSNDDAAVYALDNENAIISTVDFFTPIVNNAFDFGRIAATNAISDVYAMGGKPFLATAILSWPTDSLPLEMASEVINGAKKVCSQLGIRLAGGHSVKGQEPMFGLSVNGLVAKKNIKRNNSVAEGDLLYLTKPIGLGILASAHKKNLLSELQYNEMLHLMLQANCIGEKLGSCDFVNAITDITGFGLVGHLAEMLSNDEFSAQINYDAIPKLQSAKVFMNQFIYSDNTTNNYNAVKDITQFIGGIEFLMLCDPQTSGGLIISVDKEKKKEFELLLKHNEQPAWLIGNINRKQDLKTIIIT